MPLQQLPQLLDLGSHAALGSTAHGRVLLHAVDNAEDLGDIAAKQGAGEAKRRGVSGERGCRLLALHARCLQRRGEWRRSLFLRAKTSRSPASALPGPGSSCLWQTKESAPRGERGSLEANSSGGLVPPGQGMSFFQSLPTAAACVPLGLKGSDVVPPLQLFQAQQQQH